ncbi:MAG: 8-oxo-dGTP diphosphatase [Paracoccaceae bacterium]|jgi:8-oxo-dGTP diphosphatase
MRRFGQVPNPHQRYHRRPGVYGILLRAGALLTTFQEAPIPEFQLPGGGIDRGEHPIAALHREVREETGWRIKARRHLGTYKRFTFMPEYDLWAEKICHIYLAWPVIRISAPTEKGHVAVWMDPNTAINQLASDGDRFMLYKAFPLTKNSR